MVLEEESRTNRLVESLKLWKALTSSQFFKKTPFVLFLNKSDLFAEKVKISPLSDVFLDYEQFSQEPENANLSDFEIGWRYISRQYKYHFSGTGYYVHLTCAIDTENCLKVFKAVRDSLFREVAEQFR